jgi:hypothetical protein
VCVCVCVCVCVYCLLGLCFGLGLCGRGPVCGVCAREIEEEEEQGQGEARHTDAAHARTCTSCFDDDASSHPTVVSVSSSSDRMARHTLVVSSGGTSAGFPCSPRPDELSPPASGKGWPKDEERLPAPPEPEPPKAASAAAEDCRSWCCCCRSRASTEVLRRSETRRGPAAADCWLVVGLLESSVGGFSRWLVIGAITSHNHNHTTMGQSSTAHESTPAPHTLSARIHSSASCWLVAARWYAWLLSGCVMVKGKSGTLSPSRFTLYVCPSRSGCTRHPSKSS